MWQQRHQNSVDRNGRGLMIRLTKRWSEPLTRHGESSTGFDFMKQFQQLATVHPPRRVSGG